MSTQRPWLANYPSGVPAEIDLSEFSSVVAVLETACERFRNRPAFSNMGKQLSYDDVDRPVTLEMRLRAKPCDSCDHVAARRFERTGEDVERVSIVVDHEHGRPTAGHSGTQYTRASVSTI